MSRIEVKELFIKNSQYLRLLKFMLQIQIANLIFSLYSKFFAIDNSLLNFQKNHNAIFLGCRQQRPPWPTLQQWFATERAIRFHESIHAGCPWAAQPTQHPPARQPESGYGVVTQQSVNADDARQWWESGLPGRERGGSFIGRTGPGPQAAAKPEQSV